MIFWLCNSTLSHRAVLHGLKSISLINFLHVVCVYTCMHTQKYIHKVYQLKEKMEFQMSSHTAISMIYNKYIFWC